MLLDMCCKLVCNSINTWRATDACIIYAAYCTRALNRSEERTAVVYSNIVCHWAEITFETGAVGTPSDGLGLSTSPGATGQTARSDNGLVPVRTRMVPTCAQLDLPADQ